jgi:hypothetical protein
MSGVAIATTMSISVASAATQAAFEGGSAGGSFFTQTSTVTIQGGLGTQTFTAQSGESLETFFHVVDAAGKVVAQDDRQGLPTNGWQPGMRFLSLHELHVPADAAPGPYRVLAGLDRRTASQPSRSLGELGVQVEVLVLDVQA